MTCIDLGYWPNHFKKSTMIIISKPNKLSYDSPKSFRPIALLNTLGKLIKKVIGERIQFHITSNDFIHPISSSQMVDLVFLYFTSHFYFYFVLFFYFLFLEQLELGQIGHAVTSVTIWWHSHKTDHEIWENLVKDSKTDDVIQHEHHMLAS